MKAQEKLGRYTILRELGRGAIGAVYAAQDSTSGASVALKTLDPALLGAADAKLAEVFLNNARSAGRLRHANIVQVHDAGEAAGTAWIAMELVEGRSLRSLLDLRPLPLARALRIFDDIASALAYAHEEGMVHRGVKPTNIIVQPSGTAKIGDFGIGQIGEAAMRYMSPEQVRGAPVDTRSDLFSLGVVFYEMLTGQAPFSGKSPQDIRHAILSGEPLPPSELNPLVPDALDRMVLGLLTRHPDGRPADARILLRDLHRVEEGLGLGPSIEVAPAKAGAHTKPATTPPVRPEPARIAEPAAIPARAPTHAAPPPRIPRPNTEAVDFGGFRPGAADTEVLPDQPMAADPEDFDHRRAMMQREARRKQPSGSRSGMFTALGLMLLAVGAGFGGYMYYMSGSMAPTPAAALAAAPAPAAEASREPVAAVGEWKSARPDLATQAPREPTAKQAVAVPPAAEPIPSKPVTERAAAPQPAAPVVPVNTPRPIAPAPVAEVIKEPTTAPAPAPAPAPVAAPVAEAPGTLFGLKPAPTNPLAAEPLPPPPAATPVARAPEQPAARPAPAKEPARIKQPAAKAAERPAQLILAVSPGSEVYINGEHRGTAPQTKTLDLEPGMYQVEIRSGSRKPYLTYVTVQSGDQRRIQHDFNARPSAPPG